MRRSAFLLVAIVLLAAAVFAASASASTTYHGKFTSGTGLNASGPQPLFPKGTWNVTVGAEGTQITGIAYVYHYPLRANPGGQHETLVLHPSLLNQTPKEYRGYGGYVVHWTDVAWSGGVLTAHGTEPVQPGITFSVAFTLDPTATVPVTLRYDMVPPYASSGWLYWEVYGDLNH
jgi:hypothetical protein